MDFYTAFLTNVFGDRLVVLVSRYFDGAERWGGGGNGGGGVSEPPAESRHASTPENQAAPLARAKTAVSKTHPGLKPEPCSQQKTYFFNLLAFSVSFLHLFRNTIIFRTSFAHSAAFSGPKLPSFRRFFNFSDTALTKSQLAVSETLSHVHISSSATPETLEPHNLLNRS